MRLVDDQVVDPGLLKAQPRITRTVEPLLEPLLDPQHELLEPLDGQAALTPRAFEHRAQLVELTLTVGQLGVRRDGQSLERRSRHDDRVPVVRGCARDERAAFLAGEIVPGGGEHPRLRVELKELAGELLEHVVRDDHGRLVDHRQAAKLARADHHLGGLARANLVKQPDGGL